MKLSVIIAYYNADDFIFPLLESLLDQGFQKDDYEIIVVDDGSPNDVSKLKEFCRKSDIVKYVWQENARASAARNNGLKVAKGDYIYFCDNDDMVSRKVLSRAYDIACGNHLDMLFFNRVIIKDKELPPPARADFTLRDVMTGQQYYGMKPSMSMGHWSYIISKKFIESNSLTFPVGVINIDDVSYAIDALILAKKVGYIDVDFYYWIQHPQSLSHYLGKKKMSEQYNNEKIWFVKKYKNAIESQELESTCVKSIKRQIEIQKFSLLHNSLRFLPVHKSISFLKELKKIGEYPFEGDDDYRGMYSLIYKIMNCYPLWILCCRLYSLLPNWLKQKF